MPESLFGEAMRASGARTKREAVLRELEEYNRRARLANLSNRLGRSRTFMDFGELMKLRKRELPSRQR